MKKRPPPSPQKIKKKINHNEKNTRTVCKSGQRLPQEASQQQRVSSGARVAQAAELARLVDSRRPFFLVPEKSEKLLG